MTLNWHRVCAGLAALGMLALALLFLHSGSDRRRNAEPGQGEQDAAKAGDAKNQTFTISPSRRTNSGEQHAPWEFTDASPLAEAQDPERGEPDELTLEVLIARLRGLGQGEYDKFRDLLARLQTYRPRDAAELAAMLDWARKVGAAGDDLDIQGAIMVALATAGEKDAVPIFLDWIRLLPSGDPESAYFDRGAGFHLALLSAMCLAMMREETALPLILDRARTYNELFVVLGRFGKAGIDCITGELDKLPSEPPDDETATWREVLLTSLQSVVDKEAVQHLSLLAKRGDDVGVAAQAALRRMGIPVGDVKKAKEMLAAGSAQTRMEGIRQLGAIGGDEAFELLKKIASGIHPTCPDWGARFEAVRSIAESRHPLAASYVADILRPQGKRVHAPQGASDMFLTDSRALLAVNSPEVRSALVAIVCDENESLTRRGLAVSAARSLSLSAGDTETAHQLWEEQQRLRRLFQEEEETLRRQR